MRWPGPEGNLFAPSRTSTAHHAGKQGNEPGWLMNRFERLFGLKGEARVAYLHGEFRIDSPGDFVVCAVTGKPIAIADLRYWSVELQEPYSSAAASLQRHLELNRKRPRPASSADGRNPAGSDPSGADGE